jgi:hypothetical protein
VPSSAEPTALFQHPTAHYRQLVGAAHEPQDVRRVTPVVGALDGGRSLNVREQFVRRDAPRNPSGA